MEHTQALVHLLLGDEQRGQEPQPGSGGEGQQAPHIELGAQFLVVVAFRHINANHQP